MRERNMKAGFICSAGGAPVFAALQILQNRQLADPEDFFLISDRQCGAIDKAVTHRMPHMLLPYKECASFSKETARLLAPYGICILLYSRKVCKELYCKLPTWNIHPSLLPDFAGLGAVEEAFKYGVSRLGATLHLVTETLDAGPILSQISDPVDTAAGIEYFRKLSFLQKTWLILLILDLFQARTIQIDLCSCEFSLSESVRQISASMLPTAGLQKDFLEFKSRELGCNAK